MNSTLKTTVLQHLKAQTKSSDWTLSSKVIESRECLIYKASSQTHTHDIAIKVYRKKSVGPANPIGQHKALENIAPLLNQTGSKYRVPQCYGYLPEQHAFMMEWINAPTLQYRLLRFCYNKQKQQSDLTRTFKWLKKYHDRNGKLQSKAIDTSWYFNQLQKHIQNFDLIGLLQENPTFKVGLSTLQSALVKFDGIKVPYAKPHGDCTPSNILIDDDITTGIDLHESNLEPVCNEISLQLSYISTGYINMLTSNDMKQAPENWELINLILDAYGYSKDKQQREFLLTVFLYQMLRRWLVVFERNINRRTPLLDRWIMRHSKIVVEGLSKTLLKRN